MDDHPLRIWRKIHGLSLRKAALLFGVTRQAVYVWERNLSWPTPRLRRKIAKYTGIPIRVSISWGDRLMGGRSGKTPQVRK